MLIYLVINELADNTPVKLVGFILQIKLAYLIGGTHLSGAKKTKGKGE
jgi:hypothetical protein